MHEISNNNYSNNSIVVIVVIVEIVEIVEIVVIPEPVSAQAIKSCPSWIQSFVMHEGE